MTGFKAARLQIHTNFHEHFENTYLKVKYCEVNKDSNLHIANGTYTPRLLPKKVKIYINTSNCVSNAEEL
jgi:hypothetical protein